MLRLTTLAAAALLISSAAAAEQFVVEAELWLAGEKHAAPTLIVAAGSPASVSRGDEDGSELWRLEVEVERAESHILSPGDALWVHVGVHQKIDGEWEHLLDSILGVPEGQTATLSVVDGDAEATPETAEVYLRLKTSRLRPAEP
jgi:hypothetical protein